MARLVQRTQVRQLVGAAGPERYAVVHLGRRQGRRQRRATGLAPLALAYPSITYQDAPTERLKGLAAAALGYLVLGSVLEQRYRGGLEVGDLELEHG